MKMLSKEELERMMVCIGSEMDWMTEARLRSHIAALEKERDEVQRFKAYVHQRLDSAGVPVDPPSGHKAHGCRIGGRLDVILQDRDAAISDNAAKDKAFAAYVEMYGVQHGDVSGTETTCPEDDTCECPHVIALNAAFGHAHPGAALLEEHRKALAEVDRLRTARADMEYQRDQLILMEDGATRHAALVRARNEGLEQAALKAEVDAKWHSEQETRCDLSTPMGRIGRMLAEDRSAVLSVLADDIRAMKEIDE